MKSSRPHSLPAEPPELGTDPLLCEHLQVRPVQQTARGHVPPAADELGAEVEMRHVRDARHQERGVAPVRRECPRQLGKLAEHGRRVGQVLDDVEHHHRTDRTPCEDICELGDKTLTHREVDHMALEPPRHDIGHSVRVPVGAHVRPTRRHGAPRRPLRNRSRDRGRRRVGRGARRDAPRARTGPPTRRRNDTSQRAAAPLLSRAAPSPGSEAVLGILPLAEEDD